MRQRKIKDIEIKLEEYRDLIAEDPAALKGSWRQALEGDPADGLYLEIGCGKGQFIAKTGALDPEGLYVAAEGLASVVYRALTKVREAGLTNVRFITEYINDLGIFFDAEELDGIFMNFSDPWPKQRNYKRRLTYSGRLAQYAEAIRPGGFIRFKTDNDDLFDFTLAQVEECSKALGLEISAMTRDLHASPYAAISPSTEYEDKFAGAGKSINYVELIKAHSGQER